MVAEQFPLLTFSQGRQKQLKSGPAPNMKAVQQLPVMCEAWKKISLLMNCQEAALSMKMRSQYMRGGTLVYCKKS